MSQSRQLAAIMFADIVGYTAMMQNDEKLALILRNKLKSKLESELALHGGKIVKFSGDGALCSFSSAIESIRVATAVQLHMQQDPIVPLRIGVHQADVVFEDGDVYGDGVNIASRLESLAIPGSIFISAKVYDDIKNQKDIQSVSLGKYLLKNVSEPMEIFSISNPGLEVPINKKLEGKGIKYVSDKISFKKRTLVSRFIIIAAIISILGYLVIPPIIKRQNARNKLLPAIQKLVDENFRPPTEAYDLGLEAEKYVPNDSVLIKLWPAIAFNVSMETDPEGAEVFWKDYHTPDATWRSAGTTPIKDVRFPRGYLRMEIRKEGYQTIEYAGFGGQVLDTLKLDALGSLPENMIRIPAKTARMHIVGLEQEGGKRVAEFLIDRHEVTNQHFKEFIDAGGYTNDSLWQYPFYSDGREISSANAIEKFVDKTGRRGPANWEAGTYPDGMENHPVTGISWYEAAAYAAYANKQLPTVFHWSIVAQTARTEFIVPLSNYNGKSTVPVGSMKGYSFFGVYDLAGNAREWCFNESNQKGLRYILGGGWNDPTYAFNDSYTQSAMDRSTTNGFRCIKALPGDTTITQLTVSVSPLFRDYRKERPVDDKTFGSYLNQFVYDKKPLEPKEEENIDSDSWKAEKITFDAGYNNERMQVWVYLPKDTKPPYQAVIFFPGSGAIHSKQFIQTRVMDFIDFILKSGRALVIPIYKGTHERHDDLNSDLQNETVFYKDHVVMWGKEFGRTIDFLESRSDIQADKIGYLGFSWGGFMGGIIPAIEKRIKAIVLNVGGIQMNRALPEVDQLNYLPRVTQPILMLNGKHDMFFPLETSQKPMYDLLGTPARDKKRIVYESGHLVPRTDFVKETLLWFDQYLGPVK
ncbi:SUMF1/EgtB/PvdO family nonheme iron enzyme [Eudoraea adriatica]|uniref:SUMF1/EgtB/PvdO family nonheme iron enzyme n=1 Tax=Eudoraea adriatica TaxID=446681 RepID=UPI0003807198|nr:SUMF1/EgtB/PvdO family nonheme iron enzyme [Eudoraea adriatica]